MHLQVYPGRRKQAIAAMSPWSFNAPLAISAGNGATAPAPPDHAQRRSAPPRGSALEIPLLARAPAASMKNNAGAMV